MDDGLRVAAPAPGGAVHALGPLTVVAEPTDSCGVAGVRFTTTLGTASLSTAVPFEVTVNPPVQFAGPTRVTATALDAGGNAASATTEFLHVGTLVACGTLLAPEPCSRVPADLAGAAGAPPTPGTVCKREFVGATCDRYFER